MRPSVWIKGVGLIAMLLVSPGGLSAQAAKSPRPASDQCVRAAASPELRTLLVNIFRVRKNLDALLVARDKADDSRSIEAMRREADTLIDYIFWIKDLATVAAGADSPASHKLSRSVLGNRAYTLGTGQVSISGRIELLIRQLRSREAVRESRTLGVYSERFSVILKPCIDPID